MPKKGIIIGFGKMGQLHHRYLKLKDVDISAIVDISDEQRALAVSLNLKAYATLDECKEAHSADFIVISVPTDLHFHFLKIIIENYHKPIFVEKPVVRTIDEVLALERLAESYPFPIFVGLERYNLHMRDLLQLAENPSYLKITRMVKLPLSLKEKQMQFLAIEKSGGAALTLMYPDLCLVMSVFGEATLGTVSAVQHRFGYVEAINATLQFRGGFEAQLTSSWVSQDAEQSIVATVVIGKRFSSTPLVIAIDDQAFQNKLLNNDPYYLELDAFLKSIDSGRMEHPLSEYLAAVKIANRINDRIKNQKHLNATLTTFQKASKLGMPHRFNEEDKDRKNLRVPR